MPRSTNPPPTTAPPPFDPEEFARRSESSLKAASDFRQTAEVPTPPPLNKRVRVNVPLTDLAWFELSAEAQALAPRLDGTRTLLDLMEEPNTPADLLHFVAELHDARLLSYDD